MLGGLWKLISDPERFAIDHWPSLVVIGFLISIPFLWREYLLLIRSRVVQVCVLFIVAIMCVWSIRGRWDNDQFDKERSAFDATISKINSDNLAAQNRAREREQADAETNRKVLADAIADAAKQSGEQKGRADTLQAAIDSMPEDDEVQKPTKDCKVPPPRKGIDPVLKRILQDR